MMKSFKYFKTFNQLIIPATLPNLINILLCRWHNNEIENNKIMNDEKSSFIYISNIFLRLQFHSFIDGLFDCYL